MRRLVLFLALLLSPASAWAVCPGTPSDCPSPTLYSPSVLGNLSAVGGKIVLGATGVVADGVTSDDAALAAAVTACGNVGGLLILPPGPILLTGAATINLQKCGIMGTHVPAGTSSLLPGSYGTTFLITSTSVTPFKMGANWSMSGVNFYWPNQTTGSTVYPPLMSPLGGSTVVDFFLDHVNIINAYDGLQVTGGRFYISNSTIYAVRDAFQTSGIGDQYRLTGVHFSPGPWNRITGNANTAALAVAAANNTMFHLTGTPNNFMITNSGSFAWRNAFKLDSGSTIGISSIEMSLDAVATYIDASAGSWTGGNPVKMNGNCSSYNNPSTTATTCFVMGAGSVLNLMDSYIAAYGDFITTSGSSIYLDNVQAIQIGWVNNGTDYYGIKSTATAGGTNIVVKNSRLSGLTGSVNSHGIGITPTLSRIAIQNTSFELLNDAFSGPAAATMILNGNWSIGTTASAALAITGTNMVTYGTNQFDKPPVATLGTCGGSGAAIVGGIVGRITVGTTNPTTSCAFTLPWVTPPGGGGSGNCVFALSAATTLFGTQSGTPATWTLTSGATMHGQTIRYNCAGTQ